MEGERSNHNDVSPMDGGAVTGSQLPPEMMPLSSRMIAGARLCSASPHRDEVSATVKQAPQRAGCYRGSATCATRARAYTQNGEDPNGGLHIHPGPGQRIGPYSQPGGGLGLDHRSQIFGCLTSAHR
jgi:hypothetical protein